jgi:hypothetical protein
MTKNLASSVHQRLMNRAKAEQRPFNELRTILCWNDSCIGWARQSMLGVLS